MILLFPKVSQISGIFYLYRFYCIKKDFLDSCGKWCTVLCSTVVTKKNPLHSGYLDVAVMTHHWGTVRIRSPVIAFPIAIPIWGWSGRHPDSSNGDILPPGSHGLQQESGVEPHNQWGWGRLPSTHPHQAMSNLGRQTLPWTCSSSPRKNKAYRGKEETEAQSDARRRQGIQARERSGWRHPMLRLRGYRKQERWWWMPCFQRGRT